MDTYKIFPSVPTPGWTPHELFEPIPPPQHHHPSTTTPAPPPHYTIPNPTNLLPQFLFTNKTDN